MKNMDPQMMKNMTRMAQQMGGVPGMGGGGGGGGGAGAERRRWHADMANMDMSNAAEMMGKMNPDMMKAGMEMMKGMVRRARNSRNCRRNSARNSAPNSAQCSDAPRCTSAGPQGDGGDDEERDGEGDVRGANRAGAVDDVEHVGGGHDEVVGAHAAPRRLGAEPVAAYRAAAAAVDRVPGGLLTVLCAVSGVLLVGHFTEWY